MNAPDAPDAQERPAKPLCFFCVFLRLSALVLQPGSRGLAVGWLLRLVENFGLIAEI